MSNKSLNRSQVIDLAKILYNLSDHVSYVSNKYFKAPLQVNKSYKKINFGKKPRIVELPKMSISNNSVDNARIQSIAYYSVAILYFIDVLEKNFLPSDLVNFYNNINSLRIGRIEKKSIYNDSSGVYYSCLNYIKIKNHLIYSIYHELFHMASTKIINGVIYSGFYIVDDKKMIGLGLNEGYTELIANRYFSNSRTSRLLKNNYDYKYDLDEAYSLQVLIASKIEEIVGKNKMESLYLTANLHGLIKELEQYTSREQIDKFLSNMDFLHSNMDNIMKFSIKNKKLHDAYVEICGFLDECYRNKLANRYNKKSLRKEFLKDLEFVYDEYFSMDRKKSERKK